MAETPQVVDGQPLNPVSPDLVKVEAVGLGITTAFVVAISVGLAFFFGRWWLVGAGVMGVYAVLALLFMQAQVRARGWIETENELLIQRGRFFRTLTAVPYGRIQFVDVSSTPMGRRVGLKTVELKTASTTSDSSIPGLTADTADELRRRLLVKARERMSGL